MFDSNIFILYHFAHRPAFQGTTTKNQYVLAELMLNQDSLLVLFVILGLMEMTLAFLLVRIAPKVSIL
jgi:hypothetical protein